MSDVPDRSRRVQDLSPARRRLLERRRAARREAAGDAPPEVDAQDGSPPEEAPRGPLSFSQERFWVLEQLEPGNPAHHVPSLTRLTAFKADTKQPGPCDHS